MTVKENKKITSLNLPDRIIFGVIILDVLAAVIFGLILTAFLNIKIKNDTDKYIQDTGRISSGIIRHYTEDKNSSLDFIMQTPELKSFISELKNVSTKDEAGNMESYGRIQETLNRTAMNDGDIVSAWIASDINSVIVGSGGNFIGSGEKDLKDEAWYRSFIAGNNQSGSFYNTAPVGSIFGSTEEAASIITAVYENENLIGYCGIEIKTDGIKRILESYGYDDDCYVTLISEPGTVVYAPVWIPEYIEKQQSVLSLIITAGNYSDGADRFIDYNGEETHFYVDNSSINGWTVLVLFDEFPDGAALKSFGIRLYIILLCLLALSCLTVINYIKRETRYLPEINNALKIISSGKHTNSIEIKRNNSMYEYAAMLSRLSCIIKDKNEQIEKSRYTDAVTGLPNRIKLYEYLDDIISVSDETGIRFALMFVDIDNFKWLNETLGHNFGDCVLLEFGAIMSDCIKNDGKVFRFGGDEYIIITEFGDDYSRVEELISKLKAAFDKPIKVLNDSIYIKFSVGVSLFPDDDTKADLLLRNADIALHRSKENGKNRVSFYTNTSKKYFLSKAAISQKLTNALKNNELYLNYQPIISTTTYDIYGFEALLRWDSPEFGFVSPTEFIEVAEETGHIVQIGTWIFESACRFLKELCDNYRDDIIMSVNVSPVQLKRPDYIDHIRRVIDITQVKPENIQIEITENLFIDFIDSDSDTIDQINKMGISLALDDFGTGYSSLNYLKNFPIKCLKIDKSFVDEINRNKRDYALTDSIIDLVHNLGIKTIAEGIETVGQFNFLTRMRCDYIQGFLMSKPLDEAAALDFVKKYDALHKPDEQKLMDNEKLLEVEKGRLKLNADYDGGEAPLGSIIL